MSINNLRSMLGGISLRSSAKLSSARDGLLLLVILLVGMWWLTFFQYSMKWDIMDITLPWNYYLSECLNNGLLPLWNPFVNNGFPQMGLNDTWYPITWCISLVFGMDIWSIQFDYLLHLYIGGFGMYKLSRHLGIFNGICLLVGTAYMFSGFNIGNAQHLGWIIGAAWLPWLFYYFLKLQKEGSWPSILKLSLSGFFMISGAYPGIIIISAYIFFFFFLASLFKKESLVHKVNRSVKIVMSVLLCIVLSTVVIYNSLELGPYINRGSALALSEKGWGALSGFFPVKALISYIFPYAVTAAPGHWGADISLTNTYLGLLPLLVLISVNLHKKASKAIRLYTVLGLFIMGVAVSQVFPFREWLYHVLPLMDRFRFPALFRLFSIFFFLLAAAFSLNDMFEKAALQISFRKLILAGIVLVTGISIYAALKSDFSVYKIYFEKTFEDFNAAANLYEKCFLQSLLVLSFLTALFFMAKNIESDKKKYLFCGIGILEILLMSQLNIPVTVVHNEDPRLANTTIHNLPKGYPLPDLTLKMSDTQDRYHNSNLPNLHFNQSCFTKMPSAGGNSPYSLLTAAEAYESGSTAINQNPLFFLAKTIDESDHIPSNEIDSSSYKKIKILDFNPMYIRLSVENKGDGYLVFLQNYYHCWTAKSEGKNVEIRKVNKTYMAVPIASGIQELTFSFEAKYTVYSFYVSMLSFVLVCIFILVGYLKLGKSTANAKGVIS